MQLSGHFILVLTSGAPHDQHARALFVDLFSLLAIRSDLHTYHSLNLSNKSCSSCSPSHSTALRLMPEVSALELQKLWNSSFSLQLFDYVPVLTFFVIITSRPAISSSLFNTLSAFPLALQNHSASLLTIFTYLLN